MCGKAMRAGAGMLTDDARASWMIACVLDWLYLRFLKRYIAVYSRCPRKTVSQQQMLAKVGKG
mgnify:CR=1 FL=1|jgi:hypothetical protein